MKGMFQIPDYMAVNPFLFGLGPKSLAPEHVPPYLPAMIAVDS